MSDIAEIAMERLRAFERQAGPQGYFVAFSGGKDSVVLRDIVERSGVRHELHFSVTTLDPPELYRFVQKHHNDVIRHYPKESLGAVILRKGMMPTRLVRFCCTVLKEAQGAGRFVVTGVRHAESVARSKRRMIELCSKDALKSYLHPLIDWSTEAVWNYIRERKLPYCELYDEGWTRLGCVGCPMADRTRARQFVRWPRIEARWKRWARALYESRDHWDNWTSFDDMWEWWMQTPNRNVEDLPCAPMAEPSESEEGARAGGREEM